MGKRRLHGTSAGIGIPEYETSVEAIGEESDWCTRVRIGVRLVQCEEDVISSCAE